MPTGTTGTPFPTGIKVCPPPNPRQGVGPADHPSQPAANIHFSEPSEGSGKGEGRGTEPTRPTFPVSGTGLRPESRIRTTNLNYEQEPRIRPHREQSTLHSSGDLILIEQEPGSKGRSPTTTPRPHVTPSGYKNVRVFVPKSLHFRLVSASAASEMSLQNFVIAWLERATPLTPTPASQRQISSEPAPRLQPGQGPQGGPDNATGPGAAQPSKEPAPGPRPCRDPEEAHSLASGPGAAQEQQEPAPCHRPAQGPLGVPGEAVGPSAALLPEALALSRLDRTADPSLSGSLATVDPNKSPSGHDLDPAEAERTGPR